MPKLVFWLDVDNTLVANDDVKNDLDQHLQVEVGPQLAERFWALYEEVRKEESLVDIPLALERFRAQTSTAEMDDLTYQHVRSIFNNYPFSKALYPYALETVRHLNTLGTTVIVSDGDPIFQSEKIISSNLAEAVGGRVLLYIHKQEHLQETIKAYPGDHYVAVDDKPDILLDTKNLLGDRATIVFVRQGKYAKQLPEHFSADITVDHIGDLRTYTAKQFLEAVKQ
jgi:phosphoglycolate phosphatase-like HAD superfamily hydrolase